MRERLTGTLIVGYMLTMILFSLLTLGTVDGKYGIQNRIDVLPSFNYYTLDGKKFTNKDLNENSRLMIVYFNPMCDVCQKEVGEIVANMDEFKDIQIVMVSPNTKEEIMEFSERFKLNSFPQITLLHDSQDEFYKQFNARGYPAIYLYDDNRKLISRFESQTDVSDIKNEFDQNMSTRGK